MHLFARLFTRLDGTNKTLAKLAALEDYFAHARPADAAWAVYFLTGRKIKRLVKSPSLRAWAAAEAGVSDWLFDESYEVVGDLAETIALLLPPPTEFSTRPLSEWVEQVLLPLRGADDATQQRVLGESWRQLDRPQRFVFNKLLTGEFRVGVSQGLVMKALAKVSGQTVAMIAHRLMGDWEPTAEFYAGVVTDADDGEANLSRPYPFFLAHALEAEPESLGELSEWLVEWKWDGIRAQMIRRQGTTFLWSRGEELITERFPELLPVAAALPEGTVLDGEIVAYKNGVLPFGELQKRIGRKTPGKKILADVPVRFIAFDILEQAGEDIRELPLAERRRRLEGIPHKSDMSFEVSRLVDAADWASLIARREDSREQRAEGLMLKRLDSPYGVGRPRGPWWKWKVSPFTIDAVLVYAQRGHGRRAALYTDYTFAVWKDGELVPFAKAYSGLTDAEIAQVDRFVRRNTLEKFGPVRHVEPQLVMELAFENIRRSPRHKSGIAVRFPRIARWRHDKLPKDADSLETIVELLPE
ncbi:MAG: ATP-dependent DNA ligase [Planctomycetota bacterium]|nr:ATP-dependent DNA ligase [Planctomycetaceae bacterium]MDQ3329802.1 ATP-dependent DNA ligase [Planctomycetota bacterium]